MDLFCAAPGPWEHAALAPSTEPAAASPPPGAAPVRAAAWAGPRRPGLVALALAALLPLVALALGAVGRARRTVGPARPVEAGRTEVLLVARNADVAAAWATRGERGRVVLHAGRFLHFVPADPAWLAAQAAAGAGSARAVDAAALAAADQRSYLWAAAEAGVARRIAYLVPPRTFARRLEASAAAPGGATAAGPRDAPWLLRTASPAAPGGEPVLLDVNASWFDEAGGDDLLRLLGEARVEADLVILSLAEDAPAVPEAARAALRAFAARLAGRPVEVAR